MNFWIVGGFALVLAALVFGRMVERRIAQDDRDAAMADKLEQRRNTERFIERIRNGGL